MDGWMDQWIVGSRDGDKPSRILFFFFLSLLSALLECSNSQSKSNLVQKPEEKKRVDEGSVTPSDKRVI